MEIDINAKFLSFVMFTIGVWHVDLVPGNDFRLVRGDTQPPISYFCCSFLLGDTPTGLSMKTGRLVDF